MSGWRTGNGYGWIFFLPYFLAVGRAKAHGYLIVSLTRKDIQPVAHQSRGCIAQTHGFFPLLGEFLGPGGRGGESAYLPVPIRAPPLRPILCKGAGGSEQKQTSRDHADQSICSSHDRSTPFYKLNLIANCKMQIANLKLNDRAKFNVLIKTKYMNLG
jgi:hypothetical protein